MNIQEELHKIFPIPEYDVVLFLGENPGAEYVAKAHARFFQHLKDCVKTEIARIKNTDAAIIANDQQALYNTKNQIKPRGIYHAKS